MNPKELFSESLALTALIMVHGLGQQSAQAQSATNAPVAQGATNAPTQLPDVVVKGQSEPLSNYKPEAVASPRYTEPLRDTPQSVTVIPQAIIEEQNASSLRDVLRNVPGISMQAGEGGVPAGDNLSIRGFSARTDLFVDGVRDIGGYTRDPFNLEQVEVFKGPSSSTVGRGSTGGSINLVSKTPKLAPSYGGSVGLGTDEYKRLTLDMNQPITKSPIEGTAVRLNGVWTESEYPGREIVETERWGIAPSFAIGLGTPTRVTLTYLHLQQNNVPDYGIPWVPTNNIPLAAYADKPAPVSFGNYYGLLSRDYERTTTDIPTLTVEHDFNESLSLRNVTRYGRNDRDSIITAPRFAGANGTVINQQVQSRDQVDTIVANLTEVTYKIEKGIVENTLVPGFEYDYETFDNKLRTTPTDQLPTTDLFKPNPYAPNTGPIRPNGRNESWVNSVGLYAIDTIKFNEKYQLSGGLRWDYSDIDYRATAVNGTTTNLSRADSMPSWRIGVAYKPIEDGTLYAAYGTSFNPAGEGLALSTAPNAANNLSVDPEENRTYEVGVKWDFFKKRLSLSTALFRTEKTNARTEDQIDQSDIVVLEGEQLVQGIEFGAAGSITDEWKVFGGYTFMSSEVVSSRTRFEVGRELSNTPEHSFNLWTTYDLPWHITLGGGLNYVDSRFASTTNNREAPSYVLLDAMAAYAINKNVTLRLNVYNLADKEYIDRVGGGHFIPGPRRSAVLSANFKF